MYVNTYICNALRKMQNSNVVLEISANAYTVNTQA